METECIDCPLYNSSLGICMVTGEFIENPRTLRECALTSRKPRPNIIKDHSFNNLYEEYTSILPQFLDQILSDTDKWFIVFTPREKDIELMLQLDRSKYTVSLKKDMSLKQSNLDSILKYFLTKNFIKSYKYKVAGNLIELKIIYSDLYRLDLNCKSTLARFILDPRNIRLFSYISSMMNKQIFITNYSINGDENIFVFKLG